MTAGLISSVSLFLGVTCLVPITQCLTTVDSYTVSRFLVVYGGSSSPSPVNSAWGTCPGRNFAYTIDFAQPNEGTFFQTSTFLDISRMLGTKFLKAFTYSLTTLILSIALRPVLAQIPNLYLPRPSRSEFNCPAFVALIPISWCLSYSTGPDFSFSSGLCPA